MAIHSYTLHFCAYKLKPSNFMQCGLCHLARKQVLLYLSDFQSIFLDLLTCSRQDQDPRKAGGINCLLDHGTHRNLRVQLLNSQLYEYYTYTIHIHRTYIELNKQRSIRLKT